MTCCCLRLGGLSRGDPDQCCVGVDGAGGRRLLLGMDSSTRRPFVQPRWVRWGGASWRAECSPQASAWCSPRMPVGTTRAADPRLSGQPRRGSHSGDLPREDRHARERLARDPPIRSCSGADWRRRDLPRRVSSRGSSRREGPFRLSPHLRDRGPQNCSTRAKQTPGHASAPDSSARCRPSHREAIQGRSCGPSACSLRTGRPVVGPTVPAPYHFTHESVRPGRPNPSSVSRSPREPIWIPGPQGAILRA